MKRRVCVHFYLCGVAVVISAAIGAYDQFVLKPLQMQTFVISPWRVINSYAAKPIFWACIGIILALLLFQKHTAYRKNKVFFWIGIAATAAYCVIALLSLTTFATMKTFNYLLMWLLKNTPIFLIPGILIGSGIAGKTF